MSFLTWAGLAVGLLVVVPLIAHLLRRRPPDEEKFAATRLVPARAAVAQRRTAVEDRALFAIRSLAILGLALLGATPFVKCSRLSLAREGGASVALAIVLDDSMSMRAAVSDAPEEGSDSRFERARRAALELLEGLEPGDAASVVLAGSPPRVALAATTNLDAARATLEGAKVSDRGTGLEDAVKIAGELLADVEHVDKRVVVLSDMAAGGPTKEALTAPEGVKLWVPLEELRGPRYDCGVVAADRNGVSVAIRVACTPGYADQAGAAAERRVEVRVGDRVLVDTLLRITDSSDFVLKLPEGATEEATARLFVTLTGADAIPADDRAPVVSIGGQLHAGVVSDPSTSRPPTGGAPMVEQVFSALGLHVQLRPLSTVPDRSEDLEGLSLLILDDIPGMTPGQRADVAEWVEKGGVLLVTLGPNAAHAPLGSGFSPMLEGLVRWARDAPKGVEQKSDQLFGAAFEGLDDIAPEGRAKLDLGPDNPFVIKAKWADGAPFVMQRRLGRGAVSVLTLPLDPLVSDFTVRIGFLHYIQSLVMTARALGGTARTDVGQTWPFDGFDKVTVARFGAADAMEPLEVIVSPNGRSRRAVPNEVGLYELALDDTTTTRVAAMVESEVDTRPRQVAGDQQGESLGGVEASVDISHYVAVLLLALMLLELVVRLLSPRWGPRAAANDSESHDDSAPAADQDAA